MQLSLSSLCFIIPVFWHKAYINEGKKWRKHNTIKHPGAVRLDLKQPNSHVRPQLRRTFTRYLMADACALGMQTCIMEDSKISMTFCRTILSCVCLDPYTGGARCSMQNCPPTPYGRFQLWEAPQHVWVATTTLRESFTQLEGKPTRHLLEKASANLHWVKRQLLFIRTNLSFHKP